jgi:cytoskeleton protein RodZ
VLGCAASSTPSYALHEAPTDPSTRAKDPVSTGIGAALRDAREAQGRTLDDAAGSLRARASQIAALEAEDFASFGGEVYARGFLKSYAMELGLDPAPLLETHRQAYGQPELVATSVASGSMRANPRQRATPPAWIAWVLVAVVVLAGLAVVGTLTGGSRTPEVAGEPTTPPAAPAAPEEPTAEPDDPEPEPEPEPEPAIEGVEVVLTLEDASWMRVIVDGVPVVEQTMPAGETLRYVGEREVQIRFGNAGGVRAELNGEDVGAPGARGAVVEVLFTPDGVATL